MTINNIDWDEQERRTAMYDAGRARDFAEDLDLSDIFASKDFAGETFPIGEDGIECPFCYKLKPNEGRCVCGGTEYLDLYRLIKKMDKVGLTPTSITFGEY